ncbi:hypothetical protein RD110_15270 [Rhodoferax koreense]|uniref:GDSL family lipase n=1 Tax=Rhodoferax koreensis TaxID=1842727 RepID=A0A1P8JXB9_9BURK|nr:hypothetical protein RD110_15270 [Rhodoferax koreense]
MRGLCLPVVLLGLPAAWAGLLPNYSAMYAFGDSLSDTGNDFIATTPTTVPAIPPSVTPYATYWKGRFTNGPVAVEYLWRLLARKNNAELLPFLADQNLSNKTSVSFAFGGSSSGVSTQTPMGFTVPGLLGQVNLYSQAMAGKKPHPNTLFTVWSGSNDYLQNITYSPDVVVGNVTTAIRALYAQGARDFLVPNLPDMGITPFAVAQGKGALFTKLTKQHNALLEVSLRGLSYQLPKANITRVDVYALGEALLASGLVSADVPAVEYLSPGTGAVDCLFRNPATCVDVTQNGYLPPFLFWDAMHPTTQVHGAIGTAMFLSLMKRR